MKLSVSQPQLAHGLSLVSRAVSPRNTLPVLANILVASDEGRLRLSATNLELGITCWIGARIEEEGSTTVPARTFTDLVGKLPNDQVVISLNTRTQTINLRCGSSTTDIKGIDAQEFPPIPVPDLSDSVAINVTDFKEMVQQVAFAASTDEARPVLTGVLVIVDGNEISLAATDGFRISVRKSELSTPASRPINAIVPARALIELARIAMDSDDTIQLVVPPGRGQVIFHMKDIELVSQLIDGNFPDYKVIIPRAFKTRTIISTNELLKACQQAEIIAREGTNVARLNMSPSGDMRPSEVEVSSQTEEKGKSEIKLGATVDGVPLLIAFNVRFLREVLEVIKTPNVSIETNTATTPGLVRPVGDDHFMHVIMPMHLG
ncbi:MAG TPA: DNA polymerase III subunit beta [Anaerolineaceae bacterium]|jgi:DNA polymerase III subunit beta